MKLSAITPSMLVNSFDFRSWIVGQKPSAEVKRPRRLNFLLGVGCQKGGTTWLHDYLSSHPQALMSPLKEMHIFDAVYRPGLFSSFYRQRLNNLRREIEGAIKKGRLSPQKNQALRRRIEFLQIYHDPARYNTYFLDLFARKRASDRVKLVGEITPSYSALGAKHFAAIRALLTKDYNVKVVFLMRDPIERILSAHRMVERKRTEKGWTHVPSAHESFKQVYAGKQEVARTQYEKTIAALEHAFRREEIFYGFYETLFTENEMMRLCRFLEIEYVRADFARKVNASPAKEGQTVDVDTLKEARDYYDKTYQFCARRFSKELITSIWQHY